MMSGYHREELKYTLPIESLPALLRYLSTCGNLDINHNKETRKYPVVSLYFDTPQFTFYEEKINGESYRRKVRIRQYRNDFDLTEPFFLEIKEKHNNFIFKKRASLSAEHSSIITDRDADISGFKLSEPQMKVIQEFKFLNYVYSLNPILVIWYERFAFFDKVDSKLRFTIDINLKYSGCANFLETTKLKNVPFFYIDPTIAILEIKSQGLLPDWLVAILNRFDLGVKTFSKYTICLDHAFNWGIVKKPAFEWSYISRQAGVH